MSQFFDKLFGKVRQAEVDAATAYTTLVKRIAGGDEPDAAVVLNMLAAAGKSANELKADVELATRRAEWQQVAATMPAVESAIERLNANIEVAERERKAAIERHDGICSALSEAKSAEVFKLTAIDEAVRRLRETAPESAKAAAQQASSEIGRLINERRGAEASLRRAEQLARDHAINPPEGISNAAQLTQSYRADAARHKVRFNELTAAIDETSAQREKLERDAMTA